MTTSKRLLSSIVFAGLAGSANAAEILVSGDITVSTTWTANNTYNLQGQVYVTQGATLTIQAGTLVQSDLGGTLAITRGSQIIANGTQTAPIIFTSKTDNLTSWQLLANQWGNLTLMGNAYISACPAGNGGASNASGFLATNVATMEGFTAAFPGDIRVLYGGGNDDDDSGSLSYCSFRYGGKVLGLNNELNGLSLGGVGRNTDISFVEVMNNVDDGIEIWGGTVNLKNFMVWNVGDDSFDCDQGWRGRAQFGLLVQGASANAAQGSGVGDNCIEIDGAERCDWVPVTRTRLSNITAIGQPLPIGGDHGLALRDGAGVQLTSSILMDLGDDALRDDVNDGDACGCGWGAGNTFETNWSTLASTFTAPFYTAQCDCERVSQITKSIGYRNLQDSTLFATVDALVAGNGNTFNSFSTELALQPIRGIVRAPIQFLGGLAIVQVVSLDPRAANGAVGVNGTVCPNDGFFTQTNYIGAFDSESNWALGWSAADEFGFLVDDGVTPPPQVEEVFVTSDIAVSQTWTANKKYNLKGQIYVLPGATLTIQAGTLIQSDLGGSLGITRGAQIFANGTPTAPIIWTSKSDNLTSWQMLANQWGNLTLMGNGYISACPAGNGGAANASGFLATNVATMEGLVAQFPGDTRVLYGGDDDDDDSGSLSYCSFRYGGKVIGLNNELNGLSLGGVGRNTDISFVEIMNNVDDGIEIWGGTVNIKNFMVWNVGDDGLDCDQGWRGRAQFGLIVQGASANAAQGSGVGDNGIEIDGAERCDWVPVTRTRLSNITVIGQPQLNSGDHGLALRDNAGVQLTSSILMDLGDDALRDDVQDGDACGCGWGAGSTFQTNWMTSASTFFRIPLYSAQCPVERISQITKSIGFNNKQDSTLWSTVDALVVGNGNIIDAQMTPVRCIVRAPLQTLGGLQIRLVTGLDPRAANDAVGVNGTVCPNDGFFTQTNYVGAFDATTNWGKEWSAADAFGFFDLVTSRVGVPANPDMLKVGTGAPNIGTTWKPFVEHAEFVPGALVDVLFVSAGSLNELLPWPYVGTLLCDITPPSLAASYMVAPGGTVFSVLVPNQPGLLCKAFCAQSLSLDACGLLHATNALDFLIGLP